MALTFLARAATRTLGTSRPPVPRAVRERRYRPSYRGTVALLSLVSALGLSNAARSAEIRFVTEGPRTVVEVHGVDPALARGLRAGPPGPAEWAEALSVYTREAFASDGGLPPLLGSYSLEEWGVRFEPRFPLIPGRTYVARWRLGPTTSPQLETFTLPRREFAPSTRLDAVYPSAAILPQNLLRLYLQFSAPMNRGLAREHVQLLDESGSVVEAPFVAPERELWSPDHTRLTLFFDPGRIKRGVALHTEVGPPLEQGRSYTLVVDRALTDSRGVRLASAGRKRFEVGAPDRQQPRTADWILEAPVTARDPVTLRFPEALDHGLLVGLLQVLDPADRVVDGRVTIGPGELEWRFEPEEAWGEGIYRIRVGTELEDVAGNSLRRPFEVALGGGDGAPSGPSFVDLPFRLGR